MNMPWNAWNRRWGSSKIYKSSSSAYEMNLWSMTIYSDTLHRSEIILTHDCVTLQDLITEFCLFTESWKVSMAPLQWMWYADRGYLLL